MITQRELEGRLQADARELDRDFPRADKVELRILARAAVTPREERRRALTLKRELALAGLFVVTVALLAVGVGRLRELTHRAPAHPTPTVRSSPGSAAGIPFELSTVKMVTPTIGWARPLGHGIGPDDVVYTTDGGQHWKLVSPPASANETKAGTVATYFLDARHAWLVRSIGSPGWWARARLMILRTADAGRTWTTGDEIPARAFAGDGFGVAAAVFFLDEQRGWLFVEVQTNQQPVTSEANTPPGLAHFVAGTNAPIPQPTNNDRGLTRTIYTTADGGLHWSRLVAAPQSGGSVLGTIAIGCAASGLTFASLDVGWLTFDCTNNQPGGANLPVVADTHNGGLSWNSLPPPPVSGANCNALPPTFRRNLGVLPFTCYNGGRSGNYFTGDGGVTWSVNLLPEFKFFSAIDFIDAKTGWAVDGNGDVYHTTNSGRNWTMVGRLAAASGPGQIESLQFLDSKVGFATKNVFGPNYYRTTDGGRTWAAVQAAPVGNQP